MLDKIRDSVRRSFAERAMQILAIGGGFAPGDVPMVETYDNPTEEMIENLRAGRPVKLFARNVRRVVRRAAAPAGRQARLEEGYMYGARRFPVAANNTIGSGALAAGTYPFFGKAVNDPGDGLGFPTGFILSTSETNMQLGGQMPLGSNFVFSQMGVSFNADAAVADVNQLLEACTLTFTKGTQMILEQGPVKFWPGGVGQGGFATTTATTTTIQGASNGQPDIRAVRNLRVTRTLRQNEQFAFNFVINRATKSQNGAAFALSDFVVATVWLWGAKKDVIPS